MTKLYCTASLPRAGLGNLLFPWARSKVFSLHTESTMLATAWAQFKLGPFLRRERDLRMYFDLFHPALGETRGLARLGVKIFNAKLPEPSNLTAVPADFPGRGLVVFHGDADHFARLLPHTQELAAALRAITHRTWLERVAAMPQPVIAIHVRRGDFVTAQKPEDLVNRGAVRTPLNWFVDTLRVVRKHAGDLPATVFSDGSNAEIATLLAEPLVSRGDTNSAIGDLLSMSSARLLIGSGGSSFGAWASFLGSMPTVTIPGQPFDWFKLKSDSRYIGVCDPVAAPDEFLTQVEALGESKAA